MNISHLSPRTTEDTMKSLTALLALGFCMGLIACGGSSSATRASVLPPPTGQAQMEVLNAPTSGPEAGSVSTYLMTNPAVSGANFFLEWAAVDQGPGANPQYVWTSIDSEIQPWIAAGKKVNLIVWPVADASTNTSTPPYVLANLGSANTTTCNGEVTPNYFEAAFQTPYQQFMTQVVQHYGANASVGYIRFGLARGGETYPNLGFDSDATCSNAFLNQWGWTSATWKTYLTTMLNYEGTLNSPKQLMVGLNTVNSDTSIPDAAAAAAVSNKIGIGSQGFQQSDIANFNAGAPCIADWCSLFGQYAGQVPLELQTLTQSDPSGTGMTGSLVSLLPFAVERHATIIELYYQDWLIAYDPSYSGYDASYAGVIQTVAAAAN
jgi:hypothetical protein